MMLWFPGLPGTDVSWMLEGFLLVQSDWMASTDVPWMLEGFLDASVRLDGVNWYTLDASVRLGGMVPYLVCLVCSRFSYVSSSLCLLARRDLLTKNMWTVMGDIQDALEHL